jgi:predicted dehydrogenase
VGDVDVSVKTKVGVGMVGAGFMCRSHSNAYHKSTYFYWNKRFLPVLVGVGDVTREGAEEAAARFGYRYGCQGWEQLLKDPDIGLIDVCVGDRLHKQVAVEAARAGKAILCEKPLALSVDDAREMVEEVKRCRVINMCGFNYRFLPAVLLARQLIEQGHMGTLYGFNGCYCQDQGADDRVPAEKLWYVMGPKASGASVGIGSHLIDMSRFLVGEIGSVSGFMKTYNKTRSSAAGTVAVTTDEEMLAVVEFKNGASGLYKASAVSGGRKNYFSWEINGSGGSMTFNTEDVNVLNVYLRDSAVKEVNGFTAVNVTQLDKCHPLMEHFWPRGSGLGWEDAHVNEIAHMLDSVAGNGPVAPLGATFEDGLRVVSVLEAVKRSEESGRRIYLNE